MHAVPGRRDARIAAIADPRCRQPYSRYLAFTGRSARRHSLGPVAWRGCTRDDGYVRKKALVDAFDLKEFLAVYPRDRVAFRPEHTSDTAPLNDYTADWPDVSNDARRKSKFTCTGCDIRLAGSDSRFLHVHHKNGLKYDNREINLDVLCIGVMRRSQPPRTLHLTGYWQLLPQPAHPLATEGMSPSCKP